MKSKRGGARPGAGRPYADGKARKKHMSVRLQTDIADWMQPNPISNAVLTENTIAIIFTIVNANPAVKAFYGCHKVGGWACLEMHQFTGELRCEDSPLPPGFGDEDWRRVVTTSEGVAVLGLAYAKL